MSDNQYDDAETTTSQLRSEILQAQEARTDLLKYKLLVCAAVGAVAVGTGPSAGGGKVPYVVGIIPPVCLYIDVICKHNDIRILVIGRFLGLRRDSLAASYERFASNVRHVFGLEAFALSFSTWLLSAAIATVGIGRVIVQGSDADAVLVTIEIASGVLGVLGTVLLRVRAGRLLAAIAKADGKP